MTGGSRDDNDTGGLVGGVQLVLQLPPFRLTLSPRLHHKASLSTPMPLHCQTALSTSLRPEQPLSLPPDALCKCSEVHLTF